jgi:hypothetical protein
MNVVATLFTPEEVGDLRKALDDAHVPYELRVSTDEGGLEMTEFLATDAAYENACDTVENWQSARTAAVKARMQIRCVKCGSPNWEETGDDSHAEAGLVLLRCKSCGCVFTRYDYRIAT